MARNTIHLHSGKDRRTNSNCGSNPVLSVLGYGPGIPGPDGGSREKYNIRNIIMVESGQGRQKRGIVPESDFMRDIHIW